MIRPRALSPGSTLRLVAPASAPDPYEVQLGVRKLTEMGFRVTLGRLVGGLHIRGYLSGTDEERAEELTEAFLDPEVDAVVCAAGGYGSLRILPHLDFDVFRANPKVFLGFSDITALHVAINQRAGLVTFHGPMGNPESEAHFSGYTRAGLAAAVATPAPLGLVPNPPDGPLVRTVVPGRASGPITGGNLSLVAATLGTPWEIDTRGRILFLEDWNEPPFTLDTYLTQLRLAGKLDEAAGIVFGEFINCKPDEDGRPNLYLEEVLQDAVRGLDLPVVYGHTLGHGRHIATLPLGVRATLDADARTLRVDEAAVVAGPHGAAGPAARAPRALAGAAAHGEGATR